MRVTLNKMCLFLQDNKNYTCSLNNKLNRTSFHTRTWRIVSTNLTVIHLFCMEMILLAEDVCSPQGNKKHMYAHLITSWNAEYNFCWCKDLEKIVSKRHRVEMFLTVEVHFKTGKVQVKLTYVFMAVIVREQVMLLNRSILECPYASIAVEKSFECS
jgi:hypothetical protein